MSETCRARGRYRVALARRKFGIVCVEGKSTLAVGRERTIAGSQGRRHRASPIIVRRVLVATVCADINAIPNRRSPSAAGFVAGHRRGRFAESAVTIGPSDGRAKG